jgi:hypothetical protein
LAAPRRLPAAVPLAGILVCVFFGAGAEGFASHRRQPQPRAAPAFLAARRGTRTPGGGSSSSSSSHRRSFLLPVGGGPSQRHLGRAPGLPPLRAESSSPPPAGAKNASDVSRGEIRDYRKAMSISRTNGNGGGGGDKVRFGRFFVSHRQEQSNLRLDDSERLLFQFRCREQHGILTCTSPCARLCFAFVARGAGVASVAASRPPQPLDVTMKFGGSSLANYERVDHVARLIAAQLEAGYRPRAVVCSAMGKTTNSLLSAGEFALGTFGL